MATITRTNGGARNLGTDAANISVTGRTLTHYTVTLPGLYTYGNGVVRQDFLNAGSDYEKLVLAIEQVGSIELLGQPLSGNLFHVALTGAAPSPSTGGTSLQAYANGYVNGSGIRDAGETPARQGNVSVAAFTY
jgi:hypothetical protein